MHHHNHRRRKKRPNYGTRSVDVVRGQHGFGFTISGQQPCILSCIVANSPADLAGLRAGDFLISVNGFNVSKLPHEAVVQLIGSTIGTIRISIAENYYSDSSDDDVNKSGGRHHRSKHPHHKFKSNAISRQTAKSLEVLAAAAAAVPINDGERLPVAATTTSAHNVIHSPTASNHKNIFNVSAMVRPFQMPSESGAAAPSHGETLEYSAVVGYLGTIEMPKQIPTTSKLQVVRSCIRKMRQEKRNPLVVLMTIYPNCLTLRNAHNILLAKYPSNRLSYISSSNSEKDNRFFGLVTTTIYNGGGGGIVSGDYLADDSSADVLISNSCHVFGIDPKLTEHTKHLDKAIRFNFQCTMDPISNMCLEFPNNSEYVVNIIRSMYTLKVATDSREGGDGGGPSVGARAIAAPLAAANSPQPSEITTASSNSDSGIGFHNDFVNISDRILVVDFPGNGAAAAAAAATASVNARRGAAAVAAAAQRPNAGMAAQHRPATIINDSTISNDSVLNIRSRLDYHQQQQQHRHNHHHHHHNQPEVKPSFHIKSKSMDMMHPSTDMLVDSRLTVRAINDDDDQQNKSFDTTTSTTYETIFGSCHFEERAIDVPMPSLRQMSPVARSCDDIMMTYKREADRRRPSGGQASMDDISLLGVAPKPPTQQHTFLSPKPVRKKKKKINSDDRVMAAPPTTGTSSGGKTHNDKLMHYKLSPKVYGVCKPTTAASSLEDGLSFVGGGGGGVVENEYEVVEGIDSSDAESVTELSLQFGHLNGQKHQKQRRFSLSSVIKGTYSEPDLQVSFIVFFLLFINFQNYEKNGHKNLFLKSL